MSRSRFKNSRKMEVSTSWRAAGYRGDGGKNRFDQSAMPALFEKRCKCPAERSPESVALGPATSGVGMLTRKAGCAPLTSGCGC